MYEYVLTKKSLGHEEAQQVVYNQTKLNRGPRMVPVRYADGLFFVCRQTRKKV